MFTIANLKDVHYNHSTPQ